MDLAKVGNAFGFAVPPRVNVTVGGGSGGSGRGTTKKRPRSEDDDGGEALDVEEHDGEEVQERAPRRENKQRRVEQLGQKSVEKEIYKKSRDRKRQADSGVQWSR